MLEAAAGLRAMNWARQHAAGVTDIPSNDFSLYDHVLDTSVMVGAIPLREGADIGGGEMRVVDAVRQAGAAIQDRGGSVPPAPAGQEWVLVELLLICEGDTNCTPDTGAFRLTGGSGAPYPPAAGFALAPIFGREVFAAGQGAPGGLSLS